MANFKELVASIKGLLKDNLNDTNLDLITKVDKGIDELSVKYEETEKDLVNTKDKLIEVVKNTSFKDDSEANQSTADTDEPMDIDKALELAIQEQLNNK